MILTPEEKRVLLDRLFNLEMINNINKILNAPHSFNVFFKIKTLANNNPRKKDQSGMGWWVMSQSIAKEKANTAVKMPKKRKLRNCPLMLFQKLLNP